MPVGIVFPAYTKEPMLKLSSQKMPMLDNKVDWQDGAIAYRSIMNNPQGWEKKLKYYSLPYRHELCLQGTNPFLMTFGWY